jgi:hypothetical protein
MSGSTDSQPALRAWVHVGLTEITRPLTRQTVRDVANADHWAVEGRTAGLVVSESGSTFSCAEVGMLIVVLGALL